MKWMKKGKLFDPNDHKLPAGCSEYAKSPQVLSLPDRLRIYFSCCRVDRAGKYISHVAYVDMLPDLSEILGVSSHEVLPAANLGCFDEHGVFPFSVCTIDNRIYAYTSGWSRRKAVSIETAIGIAVSHDEGRTFRRCGDGPVLASSLHEPFLVVDGFVRFFNNRFHMWYIFGRAWSVGECDIPERTYKIGHAESGDGLVWIKDEGHQIIPDRLGALECQALPCVIKISGIYHMYFCYRETFGFRSVRERGYRIGHAWSENMHDWIRDDEPELRGDLQGWDGDMQCYPHVFERDGRIFMLYNGNKFGRGGFGAAELII